MDFLVSCFIVVRRPGKTVLELYPNFSLIKIAFIRTSFLMCETCELCFTFLTQCKLSNIRVGFVCTLSRQMLF